MAHLDDLSAADSSRQGASGYWYRDEDPSARAVEVLNALRRYREAEVAMRKRTRASMRLGDTDMSALRYLLAAEARATSVSPKDLATALDISSASVSVMLDRLEKSGHVTRQRHPTNRKSVLVRTTANSEIEVRDTLSEMHGRMMEVTRGLSLQEAAAVLTFLRGMTDAVDAIDHHQPV